MNARSPLPMLVGLALLAACNDDFEPEWVDRLVIQPESAHVAAGEVAMFQARPISQRDNELPDRAGRAEWSLQGEGVVASLAPAGDDVAVTAIELGTATLRASLGRASTSASVFVQPPGLVRIAITPASLDLHVGERPRVFAHLYDAQGNELSPDGFRISWQILETRIGFVGTPSGPQADLLARRIGDTSVKLIVGPLSTLIPFRVR